MIIKCPSCGGQGRVPDNFPGGRIECPQCHEKFQVAAATPKATTGAAAPTKPAAPPRPKAPPPPPSPSFLDDDDLDEVEEAPEPTFSRPTRGAAAAAPSGTSPMVFVGIGVGTLAVVLLLIVVVMQMRGGDRPKPDRDKEPEVVEAPEPEPAPTPVASAYSAPPPIAAPSGNPVQKLTDATVYIKLKVNGKLVSTGTGFVIENQGDTVLVATNKHVAVPDLSDLPPSIAPEGATAEIEAVFRSGGGPQAEQALPAGLVAADMSDELERDLAFLVVKGVKNPPRPIDVARTPDPVLGMQYTGGGFPLGDIVNRTSGNEGNPSITITGGRVSALRNDTHGRLSMLQLDGSLQPGNSGGPILDEKTGGLLGVAVAKAATADTIGYVIPAAQVRRALAGRVGALVLKLTAAPQSTAELEIQAQLVDPKRQIQAVQVQAVAADGVPALTPNADGSWPPLPNSKPVDLTRNPNLPEAAGKMQVALGGGQTPRKILVQASHRDAKGDVVYERPREVDLPDRPGLIVEGGRLEQLMKKLRRRSFAKLGPLKDPDDECRLEKKEDDFSVKLVVPGKKVFTLSPEMTVKKNEPLHNAPMTLAEVEGDFAALVRVTGDINPGSDKIKGPRNLTIPITFAGAGLVLYEDKGNFLRLERCSGTAGGLTLVHRLLIEVVRDGKQAMPPIYLNVPEGDLMLLMIRRKGRIRCLFSPDDKSIIAFREFALDFPEKVKIGLTAANISRKPFEATFEEFVLMDDSAKIDEEFGN